MKKGAVDRYNTTGSRMTVFDTACNEEYYDTAGMLVRIMSGKGFQHSGHIDAKNAYGKKGTALHRVSNAPYTLFSLVANKMYRIHGTKWIDYANEYGVTALHAVAGSDNYGSDTFKKIALLLTLMNETAVYKPDSDGYTSLHRAANKSRSMVLKILLNHEKVTKKGIHHLAEWKRTALQEAALRNEPDSVEFLLEKMDDKFINHADRSGDTALHLAVRQGHPNSPKIVKLLLDEMSKESINWVNEEGKTVLDLSIDPKHDGESMDIRCENFELLMGSEKINSDTIDRTNDTGKTAKQRWYAVNGH